MSMFEPAFWSSFDPRCFPYGDGVFGVERRVALTFEEWARMLFEREELEYPSVFDVGSEGGSRPAEGGEGGAGAGSGGAVEGAEAAGSEGRAAGVEGGGQREARRAHRRGRGGDGACLPRWRAARDLQTVVYCLWRRRQYIKQSRLMAKRKKWREALRDVGQLTAKEMYDTLEILGEGAGLKEALGNADVPERVKRALRQLLLCMSSVVGSNAHRTTLRHVDTSYCVLFGPPLVFTTPNVADPKNIVMSLMYEGAEVGRWRLLEEEAPETPSDQDMRRRSFSK